MTATEPIAAPARGADARGRSCRPCSTGVPQRRPVRDRDRRRRPPRPGSCSAPTAGGPGSRTSTRSRTSAAAPTASRATSWSAGEQAKGVVLAYDRRFASEHFARAAAEVLLAHDIPVAISRTAVPTQMSSYEVVQRGAAAGIVITASHNPWTDNGFKVKAPTGRRGRGRHPVGRSRRASPPTPARRSSGGRSRTPRRPASSSGSTRSTGYERFVRRTLDLDALRAADVSVLVEPLYGSGSGWIPRLLAGGRIRVTEIHNERNPYFGGVNPEPIRPHVDEALAMIAAGGYDLGPAARRRRGPRRRGRRAGHVPPPAGGHRPAHVLPRRAPRPARAGRRVGQQHLHGGDISGSTTGSRPTRSRSGFKFIGPRMIETGAMMGAEESGGYGFGMHLPERDGIYADLMLLDLFLRERARGNWPVSRGGGAVPRAGRAVVLPPDRRPLRPALVRRRQAAGARRAARASRPTTLAGEADRPDAGPVHQRRLQVVPRRRVLAPRPGERHGAAGPRLHGGDARPSCATSWWSPASGWSAAAEPSVPTGRSATLGRRSHDWARLRG